ncbi:unnamed protein product [Dibothriocephalus latus]|uniref:Uncharacterized protein n=1 Tax=Dibothriocephalus latus TaxID=60516 RepID=A0A3P7LDD9_DIBLA|nr:unnamed protein product [Dibothriocephalus latus]
MPNSPYRQLIFQAAAHVKTEDAFNFIKTGITEGYFIAPAFQLGMLEDPSISQIVALKEALLATDFQAYALATSTLVFKFCQRNKDCLDMPSVRSIIEELQSHLGTSCACGDKESTEKVGFQLIRFHRSAKLKLVANRRYH